MAARAWVAGRSRVLAAALAGLLAAGCPGRGGGDDLTAADPSADADVPAVADDGQGTPDVPGDGASADVPDGEPADLHDAPGELPAPDAAPDASADLDAADPAAADDGPEPPPCEPACTLDEDCGHPGYFCMARRCTLRARFCFDDRWSMSERGDLDDCGPYRCDPVFGLCRREAASSDECNTPWNWESGRCVPQVTGCDPADAACQAALSRWAADRDGWLLSHPAGTLPSVAPGCEAACARDADCPDRMCYHGTCRKRDNHCRVDGALGWVAVAPLAGAFDQNGNLPRDETPCATSYGCNAVTGECRTSCLTSGDCDGSALCWEPDGTCRR